MTVVISATGLYAPRESISNAELVASFNAYVERYNSEHADDIAAGVLPALQPSSVEFIEKASGIKHRKVMNKAGMLDVDRMVPDIRAAQRTALAHGGNLDRSGPAGAGRAGRDASDIDAVICSCSSLPRPIRRWRSRCRTRSARAGSATT